MARLDALVSLRCSFAHWAIAVRMIISLCQKPVVVLKNHFFWPTVGETLPMMVDDDACWGGKMLHSMLLS